MSPRPPVGRRLAVAGLSLVGLAVASYLTLFQAKVVDTVWDPFSLGGAAWLLRRSPLVRWLGFPDAAIGVVAYGAEIVLDAAAGGRRRAKVARAAALALGAVAGAMAAGSAVLVVLQAVYRRWCSLCLLSAAASMAIAFLVVPGARAALSDKGSSQDAQGADTARAAMAWRPPPGTRERPQPEGGRYG